MVLVEGKLVTRKHEDQTEENKFTTDLVVDKIHFCGQKRKKITPDIQTTFDDNDDDLPF